MEEELWDNGMLMAGRARVRYSNIVGCAWFMCEMQMSLKRGKIFMKVY